MTGPGSWWWSRGRSSPRPRRHDPLVEAVRLLLERLDLRAQFRRAPLELRGLEVHLRDRRAKPERFLPPLRLLLQRADVERGLPHGCAMGAPRINVAAFDSRL